MGKDSVYAYFKNILDKKGYFYLDPELFNKNSSKSDISYSNGFRRNFL